jgi:transcription antitermination protein NusB
LRHVSSSMLSRRLIRIKTLQCVYSFRQQEGLQIPKGVAQLEERIFTFGECYLFILQFPVALSGYLESMADIEKQKYFPDKERIRKLRFLSGSEPAIQLDAAVAASKRTCRFSWDTLAVSFDRVWEEIKDQPFISEYLIFEEPSYEMQRDLLLSLLDYLINASEFFNDLVEEQYPAWYDDEEQLWRVIEKTIKSLKPAATATLQKMLLPADDEVVFGKKLFEKVIGEDAHLQKLIQEASSNWDPERIALVDMIILKMALAEMLYFDNIPVKVTLNEYLDIARDYSTPNSSRFINGVLDNLRIDLQRNGMIVKSGRGLREN